MGVDLRRRAFALDGRVSAAWSRCPGSMARRARDSVALLRRSLSRLDIHTLANVQYINTRSIETE